MKIVMVFGTDGEVEDVAVVNGDESRLLSRLRAACETLGWEVRVIESDSLSEVVRGAEGELRSHPHCPDCGTVGARKGHQECRFPS